MSLKAILSVFPRLLYSTRDVLNFTGLEVMESDSIHSFLGFFLPNYSGYAAQETLLTAIG